MQTEQGLIEKMLAVRPSERQLAWQTLEFYAFVHFGMNTMYDREWGDGTEDPKRFNPSHLDTDQWCQSLKAAGMKGVILTAKHHDGFCLWPTETTTHSVAYSPYKKDIVGQLAASCQRFGLRLGLYLSPWDRHEACYGSEAYNDFFVAQLRELLSNYGELFCVWFDGACGEGPNGRRQTYDWDRYYAEIRRLQPQAVISICGPDVRWCGNEAGICREQEWSVVPASLRDNERIQKDSQQADDTAFRERIPSRSEDLGSRARLRERLAMGEDLCWYPAEVDCSLRPGWFYHEKENDKLRSFENLQQLYLASVGGNASLLLNVSPAPDGLLAAADVARLQAFGEWLQTTFAQPLVAADASSQCAEASATTGGQVACYQLEAGEAISARYLLLAEDIRQSQRIEQYRLSTAQSAEGPFEVLVEGKTVGYKRILALPEEDQAARYWRLEILACRGEPHLTRFELY